MWSASAFWRERSCRWRSWVQCHDDWRSNGGPDVDFQQQHACQEVRDNEVHWKYPLFFQVCRSLHVHQHGTGDEWHRYDLTSTRVLRSWALSFIFHHFSTIYSALSVTRSPLVPLCTARTATKSPDKSPDGSPDHSAVRYHMPSLCSPQHSAVFLFNPLWIASPLPRHDRPPTHDGAILRTASSWWTLLYVTVLFCDSCDLLLLTCI